MTGASVPPTPGAGRLPARPWVLLLVDDESDVLKAMGDLLESYFGNVTVLRTSSGRAALDALREQRVDVIVSDFKMPGMDGIDFLYLAKKDYPNLPRAMLTAYGDDELARRARDEAGVETLISKGLDPREILAKIGRLFQYKPFIVPEP